MSNRIPMLQLALDNESLEEAYATTRLIGDAVDIIEIGTILSVVEGAKAISSIKALYPNKIVIADIKMADAGNILAKICFDANADWMTVIASADINTMKGALAVAKSQNKDIQIELYGDWSFTAAEKWREIGVEQVVYHRSRDAEAAGASWGEQDISKIKRLADMEFKVTVTGGIVIEDLHLFKDIPVYIFIGGRSIRNAKDPVLAVKQFKEQIQHLWG